MTIDKPLTRDELSDAIRERYQVQVSYDMLRRNEKRWGLRKARMTLNARVVFFQVGVAFAALDKVFKPKARCGSV